MYEEMDLREVRKLFINNKKKNKEIEKWIKIIDKKIIEKIEEFNNITEGNEVYIFEELLEDYIYNWYLFETVLMEDSEWEISDLFLDEIYEKAKNDPNLIKKYKLY
jgi:hypothetical protein